MRTAFAQWQDVILRQFPLVSFLTILATMILGNLNFNPLGMSQIIDDGIGFRSTATLTVFFRFLWMGLSIIFVVYLLLFNIIFSPSLAFSIAISSVFLIAVFSGFFGSFWVSCAISLAALAAFFGMRLSIMSACLKRVMTILFVPLRMSGLFKKWIFLKKTCIAGFLHFRMLFVVCAVVGVPTGFTFRMSPILAFCKHAEICEQFFLTAFGTTFRWSEETRNTLVHRCSLSEQEMRTGLLTGISCEDLRAPRRAQPGTGIIAYS